jgi:hypothetical protein
MDPESQRRNVNATRTVTVAFCSIVARVLDALSVPIEAEVGVD